MLELIFSLLELIGALCEGISPWAEDREAARYKKKSKEALAQAKKGLP